MVRKQRERVDSSQSQEPSRIVEGARRKLNLFEDVWTNDVERSSIIATDNKARLLSNHTAVQ